MINDAYKAAAVSLVALAVTFAAVATAAAGPCADQIQKLSRELSTPTKPENQTTEGGAHGIGRDDPTGSVNSGNQTSTQLPKTGGTVAMNAETLGRAASPEDVRRQNEGKPTAAETAQKLNEAVQLDRQGKEQECMDALKRVRS
jgi:hypothetical protein